MRGCRYIPLRESRAVRTIVLASLRGRSFNRVQQVLAAGFKRGEKK